MKFIDTFFVLFSVALTVSPILGTTDTSTEGVTAEDIIELPDIIVGDQNQEAENDILGPALSEDELQSSLSLNVTHDDMIDPEHTEEDPITSSGFFEGDIVVESEDILLQILQGDPDGQLSAIKNPMKTWPGGVIPYVISSSYTQQERSLIARAMMEYHQRTCIRFVPRTSSHRDYIHILRGQGCSSLVGRNGGYQVVSLGYNCVHFGVIIHELMHAAGFWHEQSRYDRDSFVTVYWQNILPGLSYNFDKKSNRVTTDLGLPYDYNSIMHYGSYAFTRSYGAPTILPKQSGVTLGQRTGFSDLDVKSLNMLYKCSGIKPNPKPKPGQCSDEHRYCSSWASQGYCRSNAGYMLLKCKKSCNSCDKITPSSSCKDVGQYCDDWAKKGECEKNPKYMKESCKKSCNICSTSTTKTCNNHNIYCQDWAQKGQCTMNRAYMQMYCQQACGLC